MPEETPAPRRNQRKILPDLEVLDRLLELNPETGILLWRHPISRPRKTAHPPGGEPPARYDEIMIGGVTYRTHRVVWKMHHREEPPGHIDHRDGVKSNNRPSNLRTATVTTNGANAKLRKDSATGVKGVCWHKGNKSWQAKIKLDGKNIWVGCFKSIECATAAIKAARERLHGEFTNHG